MRRACVKDFPVFHWLKWTYNLEWMDPILSASVSIPDMTGIFIIVRDTYTDTHSYSLVPYFSPSHLLHPSHILLCVLALTNYVSPLSISDRPHTHTLTHWSDIATSGLICCTIFWPNCPLKVKKLAAFLLFLSHLDAFNLCLLRRQLAFNGYVGNIVHQSSMASIRFEFLAKYLMIPTGLHVDFSLKIFLANYC